MPKREPTSTDLDVPCVFQRRRPAEDFGPQTDPWVTVFPEMISVRPLRGSSRVVADQVEEPITHNVRMRFRDDVDSTMRILDVHGRIFEIKGGPYNIEDQHIWLELDVAQVPNRSKHARS